MKLSTKTNRKSEAKKRVRDPQAKRQIILEAALKELARHGFAGSRADTIAFLADVSVGTVFKLFIDKKTLANSVFAYCLVRIRDQIIPKMQADLTARESYNQMWAVYVEFLFRDPDILIFYEYQPHSDFLDNQNRLDRDRLREGLVLWIKKHQAAGVLKAGSSDLVRSLAFGSFMRLIRESIDGNITLTRSMLAELQELVWGAIALPKKSAK